MTFTGARTCTHQTFDIWPYFPQTAFPTYMIHQGQGLSPGYGLVDSYIERKSFPSLKVYHS